MTMTTTTRRAVRSCTLPTAHNNTNDHALTERKGPRDSLAFVLPLWPLPLAIVFLLWPALGVSVCVGNQAVTIALTVSDLE